MFSKLFKKKPILAHARINMRVRPKGRGELFEDPLIKSLEETKLGVVTGGGSMVGPTGEVEYCVIDIEMVDAEKAPVFICNRLNRRGAPKGSQLVFHDGGQKLVADFGVSEGLALYLNGTDLPREVYETCNVGSVMRAISSLIEPASGGGGAIVETWDGPTESALYLYGESADLMRSAIATFLAEYPLCRGARVVDIA